MSVVKLFCVLLANILACLVWSVMISKCERELGSILQFGSIPVWLQHHSYPLIVAMKGHTWLQGGMYYSTTLPWSQKSITVLTEKSHLHSSIKEMESPKGGEKGVKVAQAVKCQVEAWSRSEDRPWQWPCKFIGRKAGEKTSRLPNVM